MDMILKNILPISLAGIIAICLLVFFKTPSSIPERAQNTVTTWIKAKENNDFHALQKIYSANTIIQTEYIAADGSPLKTENTNSSRLIKRGKQGLLKNAPAIKFLDTKYEWARNEKNIIASSIKHNLNTGQKKPHLLVLAPNRKKQWFVIEEYDVEFIEQ